MKYLPLDQFAHGMIPPKPIEKVKGYQSIQLRCKDCKKPFTWDVGEQEFMQALLAAGKIAKINRPKRCQTHRITHKNINHGK